MALLYTTLRAVANAPQTYGRLYIIRGLNDPSNNLFPIDGLLLQFRTLLDLECLLPLVCRARNNFEMR